VSLAEDWTFEWLRGAEAIEPARMRDWGAAYERAFAQNPFFHPAIVHAWMDSIGRAKRVEVCYAHAIHRHGLRMFIPLVLDRGSWSEGWARRLSPAGGALFDYHDPVVLAEGSAGTSVNAGLWDALAGEVTERPDWCDLLQVLHRRAAPGREAEEAEQAPRISLFPYRDMEAYLASRSRSFEKGLRRNYRRMQAAGRTELRVFDQSATDEVLNWVPRFLQEKKRRFPGADITLAYLEALVRAGLKAGILHVSALRVNGQDASWHIGFVQGGVFYFYLPCMNAQWQHLSPGNLHIRELIAWCFANGIHTFDFLRGSEPYKYLWTDGEVVRLEPLQVVSERPLSAARAALGQSVYRSARSAKGLIRLSYRALCERKSNCFRYSARRR
jgi:CelD/BcsL family acetyltransferase involved in cellulose biosynthesis